MGLTHLNKEGRAHMVSVTNKADTFRKAVAKGTVSMKQETLKRIIEGGIEKGDVLAVAQVAGIMGAKKTSDIIPMCHPLLITHVDISFSHDFEKSELYIEASVALTGKTGIEMEALTSVSIAALTIYDMCKAIDRSMVIKDILLMEKSGGKSGEYKRREE
jgi:cyclic pyranopterin phosphate synthase